MSEVVCVVAEGLRGMLVPMGELHVDASNTRKGHDLERIAASLAQYGQRKPLVVNRAQGGKIEAGNGTFLAAKRLGWSHIAAVMVEDDAATAAGYGIADNRVGEFSEWDVDALREVAGTVEDLFTGFEVGELRDLLGEEEGPEDPGAQVDRAEELREKWGVESGQLWQLGEHRLACGDCTDRNTVARLMGNELADVMIADPPYNVGIEYGSGVNDAKTIGENEQFIRRWFEVWKDVKLKIVTPGAGYYLNTLRSWLMLFPPRWMCLWLRRNSMSHSPL